MDTIWLLLLFTLGILNLILFFKVWRMTNTVEKIFNLTLTKSGYRETVEEAESGMERTIFVKDNE